MQKSKSSDDAKMIGKVVSQALIDIAEDKRRGKIWKAV